jgi:LTXXQ motif family protein
MRKLALLVVLALAPVALHAQAPEPGSGPGPNPGRGGRPAGPPPFARGPGFGRGMRPAEARVGDIGSFLLAHTAELKLTDQQVTRLAAIARRAGDSRQAAMRTMDSLATRGMRRDSAGRGPGGPPSALRAEAERMRDQHHAEVREALGVLTPDQQATAWEIGRGREF